MRSLQLALVWVLIVLLGALGAVGLIQHTVERTVLDNSFYVRGLGDAGLFDALADDLVPRIARRRLNAWFPGVRPEVTDEVVVLARRVLSAAWFRREAGRLVASLLPYLAGDVERVALRLPVADRLSAAGRTFADRVATSPLARLLYRELTTRTAQALAARQTLPFGCSAAVETWLVALRVAIPEHWLATQLGAGTPALVAWMTDASAPLAVHFDLPARQAAVADSIALVVQKSRLFDFIREALIRSELCERIGDQVLIPNTDIRLSRETIIRALDDIPDSAWGLRTRARIVALIADYLVGRRDEMGIEIELGPLRDLAEVRLTRLVVGRLRAYLKKKPACSGRKGKAILSGQGDPLACRPTGLANAAYVTVLSAFVTAEVRRVLKDKLPERWIHDGAAVREYVGAETWALVQTGRRFMAEGFTLDEPLLQTLLGVDRVETLHRLLSVTRAGWQVTERDLAAQLGADPEAREEAGRRVAQIRIGLKVARHLRRPILVGLLLFSVAILALFALSWPARFLALSVAMLFGGGLSVAVASLALSRLGPVVARLAADAEAHVAEGSAAALAEHVPNIIIVLSGEAVASLEVYAHLVLAAGTLLAFFSLLAMLLMRRRPRHALAEAQPSHGPSDGDLP